MVARAGNDEPSGAEVDVSIFRFTLGIPGFDDANLPRLVGVLFGGLLLVNHAVSIESMTSAQLPSEALGLFLAAVACSLPSVGRRLKGGEAGKEGNKGPSRRSLFELDHRLSGKQKQELAKIHILSLNHLVAKCYTRFDPAAVFEVLQKRVLGFSRIQMLPKHSGVRPIANLSSRTRCTIPLIIGGPNLCGSSALRGSRPGS